MNTTKITIDTIVYSVCLFALLLIAASDFWAWYSGTVAWIH